nr:hypothetical protein CFP56_29048 [Quercus suber]
MEATYNGFDSLLNGFHVDGCDLSMSLYTSPMGRNYQPPQPQVTVLDDTSHISLPSSTELLNNMTYKSELLGMPDSGIGSTDSLFWYFILMDSTLGATRYRSSIQVLLEQVGALKKFWMT